MYSYCFLTFRNCISSWELLKKNINSLNPLYYLNILDFFFVSIIFSFLLRFFWMTNTKNTEQKRKATNLIIAMLDTLRLKNQELLGFSRILCQALQWETGGGLLSSCCWSLFYSNKVNNTTIKGDCFSEKKSIYIYNIIRIEYIFSILFICYSHLMCQALHQNT